MTWVTGILFATDGKLLVVSQTRSDDKVSQMHPESTILVTGPTHVRDRRLVHSAVASSQFSFPQDGQILTSGDLDGVDASARWLAGLYDETELLTVNEFIDDHVEEPSAFTAELHDYIDGAVVVWDGECERTRTYLDGLLEYAVPCSITTVASS